MENSELYKKYRPQTLDDVVGNSEIITSLKTAIASGNVPHTILLSGPSGCGKTTIARILQNELNCSDGDFEEYNCSDRNGVDFGREIIGRMQYKPMSGDCRIWLLDECHQMSTACANVLLKPLEDTPKHVYFILSTSEPDKLIPAIKTRSTHYQVTSLSDAEVKRLLMRVAKMEEIEIPSDAVNSIIDNCNGSARLALVMLDQVRGLSPDEITKVIESVAVKETQCIELCRALIQGANWSKVRLILAGLKDDPEKVRRAVLGYASKVMLGNSSYDTYERSFVVIQCMENSFYNSGFAGLVGACYNVVTSGQK